MLDLLTGWGNLVLGLSYLFFVGGGSFLDMVRSKEERKNPFGWALLLIAITCGPHHIHYGWHLLVDPATNGNTSDLLLLGLGIPPALIWEYFRTNAMFRPGKPSDQVVEGNPWWLMLLPAWTIVATLLSLMWTFRGWDFLGEWQYAAPNAIQAIAYLASAGAMIETQVRRAPRWSLSGLGLTGIFYTCAWMHLIFAAHQQPAYIPNNEHMLLIDVFGAVFATYFAYLIFSVRRRSNPHTKLVVGDIPPLRVLVVDDEPDIRFLFRTTLERSGVQVVEAAGGDDALAAIYHERPALVVLDVMLPGTTGHEVLDRIQVRHPGLPVVLVSASDAEGAADKLRFLEHAPTLLRQMVGIRRPG